MSTAQYLKNRLPFLLVNVLCMVLLSVFLLLSGNSADSVFLILSVWVLILAAGLILSCIYRKREMDRLLAMTEQLSDRYLIAEVMKKPGRAEDQVYFRILKMAEKSMLEQVNAVRREQKEYREYIEQWIHEVKTPITAIRLQCENQRSDFSRELLAELEKVSQYTEQALYYARSEHAEKDYSIREIRLSDVVHQAIADNKYLLMQNHVAVEAEQIEDTVYSDEKWIRFILNQLIANAVKYRTEHPCIQIFSERRGDTVHLCVRDNGMGIPPEDLPRIFEKGFTGQNGRKRQNSTGLGLYLCRRLCGRLGIGICARSEESGGRGTEIVLSFRVDHFIRQVSD